jgi:hypothetical protein
MADEAALNLRRLWQEHRRTPFPAAAVRTPALQEIALYESWLGSIVEAALRGGGRLTAGHSAMLEARRAEGNQGIWAAAAGQPDHVRAYVARLIAIEDRLAALPRR